MKQSLYLKVSTVALGLALAGAFALPVAAQGAEKKQSALQSAKGPQQLPPGAVQVIKAKKRPNDRTVRVIMSWAFAALPEKFKFANGKEITIDRSDPKKFYIPLDDARRVIRVAMRSANADLCGLQKLQVNNFRKMMKEEKVLGKWSPNQIIFIKQLHIATGLVVTGGFVAGEETASDKDGSNDERNKYKCSDKERTRVTTSIETYLAQAAKAQ